MVTVSSEDEVSVENDKVGLVNFKVKWEGAKKDSTLRVCTGEEKELKKGKGKKKGQGGEDWDSNVPSAVEEGGKWTTVLAVDCRGLEPTVYHPHPTDFTAESEWGSKFEEEIDLADEDGWCEYCDKGGEPVGIQEFMWRWTAI